jgi:hypothetical protein
MEYPGEPYGTNEVVTNGLPEDEEMLIPNLDQEAEGEDEPASDAAATESAPAVE